jgi:hypothetical protein
MKSPSQHTAKMGKNWEVVKLRESFHKANETQGINQHGQVQLVREPTFNLTQERRV